MKIDGKNMIERVANLCTRNFYEISASRGAATAYLRNLIRRVRSSASAACLENEESSGNAIDDAPESIALNFRRIAPRGRPGR